MTAYFLNIEKRERREAGFLASLKDFSVTEGHIENTLDCSLEITQ